MTNQLAVETFASGQIIRHPVGSEKGYWSGAPGVFYASDEKAWYLTYRIRRPRGIEPERGGEARIARSTDLKQWDDVWSVTKDKYNSASIERSCLHRGQDGLWRYFTSYVDPADGRWCTAVLKATGVRELDPARRQVVFTGLPLNLEGVKDPWILEVDGVYHLFLSVAIPTPRTSGGSHATLDIFNTGECKSGTGLATSRDLDHWEWQGVVFQPDPGGTSCASPTSKAAEAKSGTRAARPSESWDYYCRRINSVVPVGADVRRLTLSQKNQSLVTSTPTTRYLAFYDGSASHLENYEEKTGLAVSTGLRHWQTLTPNGPKLTSPHASTSLRYLDAKLANGNWHIFYEFARPDGAHDLRLIITGQADLSSLVAP